MRNKTANRKGAAMLWAVLVMLMISVISSGIIFIDHIYFSRERDENYQMQARLYAESAIELVADDIQNTPDSIYVSSSNQSKTHTVEFPDADNWTCHITVSHSLVDTSSEETRKKSGEIYLTANVTRTTSGGNQLELSEVCAKMSWNKISEQWEFEGYYNL